MAFDFPSSPSMGQVFTSGGTAYEWNGVGWAAKSGLNPVSVAAGVHQIPYFAEPEMYLTAVSLSSAPITTAVAVVNQIWFVPFVVPWTRTFTSIAISVNAVVASSNARLGLFNVDQATGRPGSVLLDAGNVTTATTGLRAITINQTINPGIYYGAVWTSAAITIRVIAAGYCPAIVGCRLGNTTPHMVTSFTRNVTFGGAFANESAQSHILLSNSTAPLIGIR